MGISSFHRAVMATITFTTPVLFAVGCSRLPPAASGKIAIPSTDGTAAAPELALLEQGSPSVSAAPRVVSTQHDIYHSRTLEVPAGTSVPAITVSVEADQVSGWNLYVGTANFTFTPENVNGESSPTEGHGDLYINDQPVRRIYSRWTHLPELPHGQNEIRVTLNANGHETLTTQGTPIEDTATIEVYNPGQASTP